MSTKEKKQRLLEHCMSIPISEGCIGCKLYPHTRYGCVPTAATERVVDMLYKDVFGEEE